MKNNPRPLCVDDLIVLYPELSKYILPIDSAPRDKPFLAIEGGGIYKCRFFWLDEEKNEVHYQADCGQPVCYNPEPEYWFDLPDPLNKLMEIE